MPRIEDSKYYKEAFEQYEEIKADASSLEGLEDYDKRIFNTRCYASEFNTAFCHADTGDWRKCTEENSGLNVAGNRMAILKELFKTTSLRNNMNVRYRE